MRIAPPDSHTPGVRLVGAALPGSAKPDHRSTHTWLFSAVAAAAPGEVLRAVSGGRREGMDVGVWWVGRVAEAGPRRASSAKREYLLGVLAALLVDAGLAARLERLPDEPHFLRLVSAHDLI